MAEVIELDSRRQRQFKDGPVHCIGCGHHWHGTAPVELYFIECPECGCMKGVFTHTVGPLDGAPVVRCQCGNDLFFITENGAECPNCGVCHTLPV